MHSGYLLFRETDAFTGITAGAGNPVDLAELVRTGYDRSGGLVVAAPETRTADRVFRHSRRAAGVAEECGGHGAAEGEYSRCGDGRDGEPACDEEPPANRVDRHGVTLSSRNISAYAQVLCGERRI